MRHALTLLAVIVLCVVSVRAFAVPACMVITTGTCCDSMVIDPINHHDQNYPRCHNCESRPTPCCDFRVSDPGGVSIFTSAAPTKAGFETAIPSSNIAGVCEWRGNRCQGAGCVADATTTFGGCRSWTVGGVACVGGPGGPGGGGGGGD